MHIVDTDAGNGNTIHVTYVTGPAKTRYTIYHESFEIEKFHGFCAILDVHKTFLYEMEDDAVLNMDLIAIYEGFCDSSYKGLHVQLAMKLFCLKTVMV